MAYKYAIVCFEDNSYSEVPLNWLCDNNKNCWWPNSKNVTPFITKAVDPVKDKWVKHKIVIAEYCESLVKARNLAEVMSCTDTEDAEKSRGKRKVISKKRTIYNDTSSDSSSSESSIKRKRTLPTAPEFPALEIDTGSNLVHNQDVIEFQNDAIFLTLEGSLVTDTTSISELEENKSILLSTPSTSKVLSESSNNIDPTSISQVEENTTILLPTPTASKLVPVSSNNIVTTPVEETSIISTPTTSRVSSNNLLDTDMNVSKYLQKIMDTLVEIKMDIYSLKCRNPTGNIDLKKIEVFTKHFPIKQKEIFEIVNNILLDVSAKDDFIIYIKTIDGNSAKEILHRILRQIFANSFAIQCSWLGLRNNIKLKGTTIMNILRDFTVNELAAQHKLFETIISEWFRHAQQRLKREK